MAIEVEFDGREAAKPVRTDPRIKPFLADSDDARTGTVRLKDSAPDQLVNEVVGEAAESREKEAEKFGQVPLTDEERDRIDFTETTVPEARAAKGIATGKGVDDFVSYFDETLTVDENREVFDRAAREGGGTRNQGRETAQNAQRLAQANKRRKQEQADRLKNFALVETDADAQAELQQQIEAGRADYDIGFERRDGRLRGSGSDFERLNERHESRSERAQSVDEQRSAKVTRDPVQWANNPNTYDYPGIDTIQPNELHESRSERAQEADEDELAPPADTKEQWATSPDQYDWPGVDTPPGMALGPNQELPEDVPEPGGPSRDPGLAVQEGPSTDREQTRVTMAETEARDVSVTPGELFGGVAVTSSRELGGNKLGEGERAPSNLTEPPQEAINQQSAGGAGMVDDRAEDSQLLEFGMETDATQHRESRQDAEAATEFGVDDRSEDAVGSDSGDDSEQQGFEVFGGGVRENETLF